MASMALSISLVHTSSSSLAYALITGTSKGVFG
jgi:hypothetical protein